MKAGSNVYRFLCNTYPNSWWEEQGYTLTLCISSHKGMEKHYKLFRGTEYGLYESFHQTTIKKKKKKESKQILQNYFSAKLL